eukprot:189245_1
MAQVISAKAQQLLALYESQIPKQNQITLSKSFESSVATELLSKWSLTEWKSAVGDDQIIAQLFHTLFSEPSQSCEGTKAEFKEQMKQSNNKDHCSIPFAFCSALPVEKGWDKNGYASKPLHIKTDWTVGEPNKNIMYNLEFRGHLFRAKKAIFSHAVGYLYGANGHGQWCDTWNGNNVIDVTTYTADGDHKLVFKLGISKHLEQQWHASDLIINLIGGKSVYQQRAKDTFKVIDIFHAN